MMDRSSTYSTINNYNMWASFLDVAANYPTPEPEPPRQRPVYEPTYYPPVITAGLTQPGEEPFKYKLPTFSTGTTTTSSLIVPHSLLPFDTIVPFSVDPLYETGLNTDDTNKHAVDGCDEIDAEVRGESSDEVAMARRLASSSGKLFNRLEGSTAPQDDTDSSDDSDEDDSKLAQHESTTSDDPVANAPDFNTALATLRLEQILEEQTRLDDYGKDLMSRGATMKVERVYRKTFHKRKGYKTHNIRHVEFDPNVKTREEYLDAIRWFCSNRLTYINKNFPDLHIPEQEVTVMTVSIGGQAFTSTAEAVAWAEGQGWANSEFESGDTGLPLTRLNQWYSQNHTPFPPLDYDDANDNDARGMGEGGYNATGGEGIPIDVRPNLVTLDLFPTRVSCIFQALCFSWMFYKRDDDWYNLHPDPEVRATPPDKRLNVFLNMKSFKEIKNYYKTRVIPMVKRNNIPMQWSTDDADVILKHLEGFKILLYFEGRSAFEKDLNVLNDSPEMFGPAAKTIHMYITKANHASMIMHRSHLNNIWESIIHKKMGYTYGHMIRRLNISEKKSSLYDNINAGDIESLLVWESEKVQRHIPMVMCAVIGGRECAWTGPDCIKKFISYIQSFTPEYLASLTTMSARDGSNVKRIHKRTLEVWFHNLSYDASLMFTEILGNVEMELDIPAEPLSSNNKLISLRAKLRGETGITLVLRDSWKQQSMSLKQWAKSYFPNDPDKWKGDFNVLQCKTEEQITSQETVSYCMRDCHTVIHLLDKMQKDSLRETSINQLTTQTITSYASRDFYSNHYDEDATPLYTHTNKVSDFISPAYCGGLCNVYRTGLIRGKILSLDIVSSYPSVMTGDLPYGIYRWITDEELEVINTLSQEQLRLIFKNSPGFYKISVTVPKSATPWLPLKTSNGLEVPYMMEVESTWTSIRILEAMERGAIVHKVLEGIRVQLGPVCKKFIDHHFTERAKSKDPAVKTIRKNIMNTLYGFFGFNYRARKNFMVVGKRLARQMMNNVNMGLAHGKMYGDGFIGDVTTDMRNEDKNLGLAAWITDRAEAKLLSYKETIESIPGYRVLYTDTDSLKVLCPETLTCYDDIDPSIRSLIDKNQLGLLKLENMLPYDEDYINTCEEMNVTPVPPEVNFITEACYRTYKEYYEIDTNNIHNVHIKACNIKELGYNYQTETHTLTPHQQKILAATLIRMASQQHTSFKVTKRKMFTASIGTFMCIGTKNELIELELMGELRKVSIGPDGWTTIHTHEGYRDANTYYRAQVFPT
jgi:hypothetical protein